MWKFKRRKQTLLIPQQGMMAEVEHVAEISMELNEFLLTSIKRACRQWGWSAGIH
jgi:hypothetical protein